jgi:hypothetical protein
MPWCVAHSIGEGHDRTGQVGLTEASFAVGTVFSLDVDVFLLMADSFEVSTVTGETRLVFDHLAAKAHFGASVFWLRRQAAFDGEQAAVEYWLTRCVTNPRRHRASTQRCVRSFRGLTSGCFWVSTIANASLQSSGRCSRRHVEKSRAPWRNARMTTRSWWTRYSRR